MSNLVSIIIPVYNLEGYIGNCLEKTIRQTYKNIEIICIDDGSTDSSAQIIKEFADKDSRIVYIYQENAGVSAARNKGLDIANGDYVMFVDGDDYLHANAVAVLLDAITKTNTSIAISNMFITSRIDEKEIPVTSDSFNKINVSDLRTIVIPSCLLTSCAKLYSKQLVYLNRFNENLSMSEDTIFLYSLLKSVNEVCYINENLYYYYLRQGSATRNGFNNNMIPTIGAYSDLCNELLKSESNILLSQILVLMYKYLLVLRTLSIGTDSETAILKLCRNVGDSWIKVFVTSTYIDWTTKVVLISSYYLRPVYELARLIQDPTMKDFYKSRRLNRKKNRKG